MIQLVDINKGLLVSSYNKRKHLILFIVFTLFIIGFDALLMATSGENYLPDLILTIVFTIAYLIYLVFYFTTLNRSLSNELNFYECASKSDLTTSHIKLIEIENEKKINNGLEYFVVKAIKKNELSDVEVNYLAPIKFDFKKNSNAKIKTFGSVIIEIEEEK